MKNIPKEQKLMMYKEMQNMNKKLNLGLNTMKTMKKVGKTIESGSYRSTQQQQHRPTTNKSAQKQKKYIDSRQNTGRMAAKPPVSAKNETRIMKKEAKNNK